MEMPVDVLNKRLGKIRDNGNIDFDNTAAAVDIDSELQEKFLFFPMEEIEAVEIEEDRGRLHAGSGPEHCAAQFDENPAWLYNHAINALALWWKIKQEQEAQVRRLQEEQERLAVIARRPGPGVYFTRGSGSLAFTAIVTGDRRVIVPMQDGSMLDQSELYDAQRWNMLPISLTDGTVGA